MKQEWTKITILTITIKKDWIVIRCLWAQHVSCIEIRWQLMKVDGIVRVQHVKKWCRQFENGLKIPLSQRNRQLSAPCACRGGLFGIWNWIGQHHPTVLFTQKTAYRQKQWCQEVSCHSAWQVAFQPKFGMICNTEFLSG
jgi:hypothetical protein